MSSLQLAATFTAVALGLLVGPLQELGERSAMYHDMVKIPGTSPAWMPLTAFSTQVRVRDDQDPQHRWWRSHFTEIFGTLVIFLAISRGVDLILLRWSTKVSARWAVRIHAVLDIFLSTVFLWKLYGFFFWIVAAQTMINYVIVVAGRSTSSYKMRVAALATVWALNIGLVLNSRQVQDYVYDATRHYETLASIHPFVRFLKLFNLGPGGLQWHSNMRFVLFRVIDFATSELLRGAGGAAPSSKEVIQGKRRKAPLLPEWLAVLRYAMYAPLVWQGPIIGYRAFCIQTQRRYRVINGRLRVAPVPWRKSFILAGKLVSAVLVREFLDHHWFASMFTHRHVHKQMRSCETAAAMLVLFLSAYMRMLLTWRYFRLWALLDGIEVTDNFPRCAFRNTSVGDMWRNMNASVHIWLLGNIYGPVCDVFKFHRRWGVVATFVFMAFWHGMFPAWVMFAAVNAVLVLLEQEALETTRLQTWLASIPLPPRLLLVSLSWSARIFTLLAFWLNLKAPQAKQLDMSRTRVLFGRAFVDESVNETIARDFGISNLERNDGLVLSRPSVVFLGSILFLMSIRAGVHFWDEHEASQAPAGKNEASASARASHAPPVMSSSHPPTHSATQSFSKRIDAADTHRELRNQARQRAQEMRTRAQTIAQVLTLRANEHGSESAMVWLDGKGREECTLSFGELQAGAAQLAWSLVTSYGVKPGDRVVLVFAPGLEFVVAFFACLYTGAIAVPVYPPKPGETGRDAVFQGVVNDCSPRLILSDATFLLARRAAQAWKVLQWTCALTCAVAGVVIPLAVGILLSYIKLKTKKVKRQNVWLPDAEWKDETDSSGLTHWLEYVLATAAILLGLRLLFGVFAFSQSELRNKAPVTESASSRAISWHRVGLGPKRGWPRFFGCSAVTKARLPPECAWASDPNAVAYLQYTSGSTGNPKGVRITHGNIMEQGFQNHLAFGCTGRGETAVNWCPQYHDLGLVVCILSGVFAGIRLVSFSPLAFMRDPLLWVRAISTYRASFSAAPNFAYGYAARKARAAAAAGEALSGLDLSCWRIAGNGGEPVRAQTLDAFANAFERFGFSRSAAFPCYGLAEHTIMVSGRSNFRPPTLLRVNRAALAQHCVEVMNCNVGFDSTQSSSSSSSKEAVVLVGCGDAYEGVEVRIIDPDTGRAFTSSHQEERVGEIWLRSHSVADGYWANPQATKEVFLAQCASADSEGVSETGEREVTFLRTGDLGFVRNGELFICGRCKDLIIVDGRNIYPQDVESTAEQAHQALRPGSSAAFANETGVVLVAELRREAGQSGETVVRRACQMAYKHVLNEQRVSLSEVIVVDAGVLPKTSSGKIRRRAVAALVNAQDATLARATRFQGRAADLALFEDSESATDTDVGMAFGDLLLDPTYASIVECIMVAGTLAASKQEVLQAQEQEQEQNEGQEQEQKQLQSVDELRDIRHEEAGQLDEEVLQKSLDEVLMGADGGKSSFSSLEAVQFAAGLEARLQQCGVDLTLPPDIAFRHPNVGALALYIHDASSM